MSPAQSPPENGLFWLGLAWPGASSPSPHITRHMEAEETPNESSRLVGGGGGQMEAKDTTNESS